MKVEKWAPIPGYESLYSVSDIGRVYSHPREACIKGYAFRSVGGCYLASTLDDKGYPYVKLSKSGKKKLFHLHLLVARAFLGEAPEGYETAHLNGRRNDPCLANIAYKTKSENNNDKFIHGTMSCGEKHPFSKLTNIDVMDIIDLGVLGASRRKMAVEFSVSPQTIAKIISRESWKHVTY